MREYHTELTEGDEKHRDMADVIAKAQEKSTADRIAEREAEHEKMRQQLKEQDEMDDEHTEL